MNNKIQVIRLMIIDCLDHFGTNSITETRIVSRFIGEFIEENDEYITLRYKQDNILDKECEGEFFKIVKSTILSQKNIEIEVNNE
ncbi:hypothetical protein LCGC14_1360040 [marine sediment metagenome]|uniref:Uncharacterized protein n=1 Tax=marine sediment metagenome TaxID=412755 RepID=A0A0F9KUG1_9ZZZZ